MKAYHLFKVHVDTEAALRHIEEVLRSGYLNEGTTVTEFLKQMSELVGSEQSVLLSSCTSALTIALDLAGVGPGTEVISTPMTCVASNTPIAKLGGKIVWADIDPHSGLIDPESIKRAITPRTRAVIAVDWAGVPYDLEAVDAICREHGIVHVQDAAHAFGARYKNRPIGDFADFTCFSFQAIKHITTGDGGLMICRDAAQFRKAKKLKWFGLDRDATKDEKGNWKGQQWDVDIEEGIVGYKANMNNLSAALGLSQLPHVDKILAGHRRNAAIFAVEFRATPKIIPMTIPAGSLPSYWVYTVRVADSTVDRDALLRRLNAEGIMAGLVHVPNHTYSCFKEVYRDLPGVDQFGRTQFSLPCGWWLSEADVRHIARRTIELAGTGA